MPFNFACFAKHILFDQLFENSIQKNNPIYNLVPVHLERLIRRTKNNQETCYDSASISCLFN